MCRKWLYLALLSNSEILSMIMIEAAFSVPRDLSSLRQWAADHSVRWADGFELVDYGSNDDWGVSLDQVPQEGGVIMQVPRSLVWNAQDVCDELLQETPELSESLQVFDSGGLQEHKAEFVLFLKLLKEVKNESSLWRPWIDSLPQSFSTGICFSESEKECLPIVTRALAEVHRIEFLRFCHVASTLDVSWFDVEDADLHKWAFNVVYTRCWGSSKTGNLSETDMVPVGDMFNHRHPANIYVENEAETVDFCHKGNSDKPKDLYLSYGGRSNPHRFLVIFGFVDESMQECYSEISFPNVDSRQQKLGCDDKDKMVFSCETGAIANSVYDSILYALLQGHPDEQTALYEAHVSGNKEAKKAIHDRYALQVEAVLYNHVTSKLLALNRLATKIQTHEPTPNLKLIAKHNAFLTNVFLKVKASLEKTLDATVCCYYSGR
jgi:hypothetical protein